LPQAINLRFISCIERGANMPPKVEPNAINYKDAIASAPMLPPSQISMAVRTAASKNAQRIADRRRLARSARAAAPIVAAPAVVIPVAPVVVLPKCGVCLEDVDRAMPKVEGHCGVFHHGCFADLSLEKIAKYLMLSRPGSPAMCTGYGCTNVVDPARWVDILGPAYVQTLKNVASPKVIVAPAKRDPGLNFLGLFYCEACNTPLTWSSGCDLLSAHPCMGGRARYHIVDNSILPEMPSEALAVRGKFGGRHTDMMSAFVFEATDLCKRTSTSELLAQLQKLSRFHHDSWQALRMAERIKSAESGIRWPHDEIIPAFGALAAAINATCK
jgi:hypothetical protein